jgi:hypothetical protein
MSTEEKLKLMAEVKQNILDYLTDEMAINTAALKSYDANENPIQDSDSEIRKMREIEAIKLRHSIHELNRHIAVIKRMII